MREGLIERLRKNAREWGDCFPSQLLLEAAAALEAAREDVKAVGTVLGGEFHYLRPSHGLPDGTMLYAIDQARGKGVRGVRPTPTEGEGRE